MGDFGFTEEVFPGLFDVRLGIRNGQLLADFAHRQLDLDHCFCHQALLDLVKSRIGIVIAISAPGLTNPIFKKIYISERSFALGVKL